jgi:hypothetical protein
MTTVALTGALLVDRDGEVEHHELTVTDVCRRHLIVETAFSVPESTPIGTVCGVEIRIDAEAILIVVRRARRSREIPGEMRLDFVNPTAIADSRLAELAAG